MQRQQPREDGVDGAHVTRAPEPAVAPAR
jgi:hypothetical protein